MRVISKEELMVYEEAIEDLVFYNLDANYVEIIKEMHRNLQKLNDIVKGKKDE